MAEQRPRILCVDDEPQVLDGLTLHLRRRYQVHTAISGDGGLELLAAAGPFAVVLSDMRMPGMNGAEFLAEVRRRHPDATRMLLTGQADIPSTVAAVNEGRIFRFLTKPCPPDPLLEAFAAAVEQHELITAERVLLEQTLRGCIAALTDILAMTNPVAFGRATRLKAQARRLADSLETTKAWQVEVAAMLSQLGTVALPESVTERFFLGADLDPREQALVERMPEVTESLLANIPRLEEIREILRDQNAPVQKHERRPIPIGARILKVVADYDDLETAGLSSKLALDTMRCRHGMYDPEVLQAFSAMLDADDERREIRELPLHAVQDGMVFLEDVHTKTGALLVARGFVVTPSFLERTRHFAKDLVPGNLRVMACLAEAEDLPEAIGTGTEVAP